MRRALAGLALLSAPVSGLWQEPAGAELTAFGNGPWILTVREPAAGGVELRWYRNGEFVKSRSAEAVPKRLLLLPSGDAVAWHMDRSRAHLRLLCRVGEPRELGPFPIVTGPCYVYPIVGMQRVEDARIEVVVVWRPNRPVTRFTIEPDSTWEEQFSPNTFRGSLAQGGRPLRVLPVPMTTERFVDLTVTTTSEPGRATTEESVLVFDSDGNSLGLRARTALPQIEVCNLNYQTTWLYELPGRVIDVASDGTEFFCLYDTGLVEHRDVLGLEEPVVLRTATHTRAPKLPSSWLLKDDSRIRTANGELFAWIAGGALRASRRGRETSWSVSAWELPEAARFLAPLPSGAAWIAGRDRIFRSDGAAEYVGLPNGSTWQSTVAIVPDSDGQPLAVVQRFKPWIDARGTRRIASTELARLSGPSDSWVFGLAGLEDLSIGRRSAQRLGRELFLSGRFTPPIIIDLDRPFITRFERSSGDRLRDLRFLGGRPGRWLFVDIREGEVVALKSGPRASGR